jgi:DNA-binding response OmpR family regulator
MMRILAVDDDADFLSILEAALTRLGHSVATAARAEPAWDLFKSESFDVMISDWHMPGMAGPELCQMVRALCREKYCYIIMLTANTGAEALIEALDSGADDFMTKPYDRGALAARLRVAERILRLHSHVSVLEGILSVCSYCRKIRHDDGNWGPLETYLQRRSDLKFSHGVCKSCMEKRK